MNQYSSVFEKNITVFQRFCPDLVKKILEADCKNFEWTHSDDGAINLKRRSEAGQFYFHSNENPEREAELWFHSLEEKESSDIIVIFGVGLGYYYKPCKQWLSKDPQRLLIFLEHDFTLLNLFFHSDRSEEILADPQVAILGFSLDAFEEKGVLEGLEIAALMMLDQRSLFSELKSYRAAYSQLSKKIKKTLQFHVREAAYWSYFLKPQAIKDLISHSLRNYWALPGCELAYGFRNHLKGIPAIICGAGPSIQDDIPLLKKYKEHALILGAGTGLNILNNNFLFPPLGVVVDPHDTTRSRMLTNNAYDVPFCFRLRVNSDALTLVHGQKLYFRSESIYGMDKWLERVFGLEHFPILQTQISSTYHCLVLAEMFGCNPIILLGLDLAYTDQLRYPKGVREHPLDKEKEHRDTKDLPPEMIVRGEAIGGGSIQTRPDWIREAATYVEFSKNHPETQLINATSKGLLIHQLPYSSLEEILTKLDPVAIDMDNWIQAEVRHCPKIKASSLDLENHLIQIHASIQSCLNIVEKISEALSEYHTSVIKEPGKEPIYPSLAIRTFREKLLTEEAYQTVLHDVEKQFHKYFFRKKYFLLFRPELFVNNEKVLKEMEYDKGLYLFFRFFLQIIEKELKKNINDRGEKRGEFVTGKRNVECTLTLPDKGFYLFEEGKYIIHDEDLGIQWEEECLLDKFEQRKCYYDSGKIKGEWFYKDGQIHGPSTFFSEEGNILSKGWFVSNKRHGKNSQYYLSGKLYSLKGYKDGFNQGQHLFFYESGTLKTMMNFHEGRLDGLVKLFYPHGTIKREVQFKDGVLNGYERIWNAEGQLILESEYRNNKPVGYSREWYSNGQIKVEKKVDYSAQHSDLTTWTETGEIIVKETTQEAGQIMMKRIKNNRESIIKLKEKLGRFLNDKQAD